MSDTSQSVHEIESKSEDSDSSNNNKEHNKHICILETLLEENLVPRRISSDFYNKHYDDENEDQNAR